MPWSPWLFLQGTSYDARIHSYAFYMWNCYIIKAILGENLIPLEPIVCMCVCICLFVLNRSWNRMYTVFLLFYENCGSNKSTFGFRTLTFKNMRVTITLCVCMYVCMCFMTSIMKAKLAQRERFPSKNLALIYLFYFIYVFSLFLFICLIIFDY